MHDPRLAHLWQFLCERRSQQHKLNMLVRAMVDHCFDHDLPVPDWVKPSLEELPRYRRFSKFRVVGLVDRETNRSGQIRRTWHHVALHKRDLPAAMLWFVPRGHGEWTLPHLPWRRFGYTPHDCYVPVSFARAADAIPVKLRWDSGAIDFQRYLEQERAETEAG